MPEHVVIVGAGPAGLTACYELSKAPVPATVLERERLVGGIARTDVYKGFRFDIGGHRFFTKCGEVDDLWTEILGPDMLERPRLSRIHYRGRFFDYPLRPLNALKGLGLTTSAACLLSYARARLRPHPDEATFEHWVVNRFGQRLYEMFFKTYTEKVWGMPCSEISADWAAQRIRGLSLLEAVRNALFATPGDARVKTLIDRFRYPRLGPGMMWERATELSEERGQKVLLDRDVTGVLIEKGRVVAVECADAEGGRHEYEGSHFLSTLPLRDLVEAIRPEAPESVRDAARALRYRDFLTVGLVCARGNVFPDNWIYVHDPEVRLGRVQNYKNWSPEMCPDATRTCLGLEYFVFEGDELWASPDDRLVERGTRECAAIGLIQPEWVEDGVVVRIRKAYPVYDDGYRERIATLREWLAGIGNLQCIGRNGQHRYNNQDHSMLTAMRAVRNLLGENHDIWDVNVDGEYHEESRTGRQTPTVVARPATRGSHDG